MANLRLETKDGPNRTGPILAAFMPLAFLLVGIFTPWGTFAALLFALVFLAECVGRLDRGPKWRK